MNTFNPLSLLKKLLEIEGYEQPVDFRHSTAIDKELKQLIDRAKAGGQVHVPKELQIEAVQRFWRTKQLTSFRDARLVSFGLGLDVGKDGRSLLEDEKLFPMVLDEMGQWRNSPRQFRKCYQGLVRSYFEYDGMAPKADAVGRKNWLLLRAYLQQNLPYIQDKKSINPEWVDCAQENPNLFTDKPAQAYGKELLQDNSERVDRICQLIGISDASWFTRALIIGQIEIATQQPDTTFHSWVSPILKRISDNHVVRDQGLQLILERYISMAQPPLHAELKEYAAQWWGNPWLSSSQSAWGGVSEPARNMVAQWLTSEFIDLFFTLLAEDGSGDSRRVRFWQQYVPSITYIRFALGRDVRQSRDKDFVELRSKLRGLTVVLDDSARSNNAFIMGMGDLMAVEFSNQSNAFYGYSQKHSLPFDLTTPVRSGPVNGPNSLKNSWRILRLSHQDNIHGHSSWEDRFKDELWRSFSISPGKIIQSGKFNVETTTAPPVRKITSNPEKPKQYYLFLDKNNIKEFADKMDCNIQDNTDKGGALWIYLVKFNIDTAKILVNSGFKFSPGKGWWKK